jgi:DNA-binding transcriptional MerR regulator
MIEQEWLTIDELARATGVTVRQVRSHQARGLVPPPDVRARTGYYGPEHRARLELVIELQAEGVKLDTVKRLLETTGGQATEVLRFTRSVRALFAQQAQIAGLEELVERFGDDPKQLERAMRHGLLRKVDDGAYEESSPALLSAADRLVALGIGVEKVMDVAGPLRRHAEGIAKLYVELFLEEIWRPFDAAGRPDTDWERMHAAAGQMREIAGQATFAMLELAVSERLDKAFGRDLARNVKVAH